MSEYFKEVDYTKWDDTRLVTSYAMAFAMQSHAHSYLESREGHIDMMLTEILRRMKGNK